MSMPRTMVVLAVSAALALGGGVSSAAATQPLSSGSCATSSLSTERARMLSSLATESASLQTQQTEAAAQLASDTQQLAAAPRGSDLAHVLAGKITIDTARLAVIAVDEKSVADDVSSLATCSSSRIAAAKKDAKWRKLVSQRGLVTAELAVARGDLTYREAQLAKEKKAHDRPAEKATSRLIRADRSQIRLDKAELVGIAKKLRQL